MNWSSLHGLFTGPPFTDPRGRSVVVGNLFRYAASAYEASLVYGTTLTADDRKLCFPRRDDECIRLQTDSDRLYHELLINEAVGALQAVEAELSYLSTCERGAAPTGSSMRCPSADDDNSEIMSSLDAAGRSLDKYFDVVPARDVETAVAAVARRNPRWSITPVESEEGSSSRSGTPAMMMVSEADADGSEATAAPTAATLLRFALPTLAAWLVSPLMSLVDTAVVGRGATPIALAALGPATMIGDSLSYLCSFLSVATTNLVATDYAQAARNNSSSSTPGAAIADRFGTATRLALLCGLLSASLQIAFGRFALTRYTSARSAAVVPIAYQYVWVRALGAPAALLARVSTATCLAIKDPVTPLVAVTASGLLNLFLDVLLVSVLGYGIGGAAWATVVSEIACAGIVVRAVLTKIQSPPSRARASLLPTREAVATYTAFAKPLVLTLIGKIATYSSLAHVATTVSVTSTAAHRVLMSIYWFTWPFAEVVSQIGQAFIPGATTKARGQLVRMLVASGVLVGLVCGGVSGGVLAFAPQLFTSDLEVMGCIRSLVPLVASCIATLALMCSMEGVLLATRRLTFLSRFYTANAFAMVTAFQLVERRSLGLHAAWGCLVGFQLIRLAAFAFVCRRADTER